MSVRRATPWITGGLCSLWALLGWIAIIPNQDILADGIQAQSLLIDPRIVLAFPGQKHGGPLEYPATVLFEWLFPGNYYANGVVRIALAFLTGYLAARLAFALFPRTRAWALISAVAVGPTLIHGLQAPGVWWLQPNYDTGWLLVTAGALSLTVAMRPEPTASRSRRWPVWALLGGLFFGLGIYAHPVMILMAVPIYVLVALVTHIRLRIGLVSLVGVSVGLIPAVISYFVNDEVNVWDPSHKPFIYPAWLWGMGRRVLGLDGISDPSTAILPYSFGFSPTQEPFSGPVQSIAVAMILIVCVVVAVAGCWSALAKQSWPGLATSLAISWLVAAGALVAFITVSDPVWHYGSGLAVLLWLSVGALPSLIPHRVLGASATVLILVVMALSTWWQNASYLSTLYSRAATKAETLDASLKTAEALDSEGVEVIYGSYADAIPIGYASNWSLRTITNKYNRFPLRPDEARQTTLTIAVRSDSDEYLAPEALERVLRECAVTTDGLALPSGEFVIAECPVSLALNPDA